MTTTNGIDANASATNDRTPPTDASVLSVAVQALQTIASEAQQAVKKLEALDPFPPILPTPRTAALMDARPINPPGGGVPVPIPRAPTGPTAHGAQMNPGEVLHPGDSLSAPNGNYLFAMQRDGNLVLYSGTCALWASNTAGKPVAVCIMQGDGNLVLYNGSGQPLWASNTSGKNGARLDVQSDGNVVIYQTNNAAAWSTNTVHTVGSNTLIYRARLKRWTDIPFAGTKGNDVLLVKLPPGATLKSVQIAAIGTTTVNPDVNSSVGTEVGGSYSGARLTNVQSGAGFVAIGTHWWFNAFSDAEYSITVWATGPTAYPVEDNGTLTSAKMDAQILGEAEKWFENNEANLITAGVALAGLCITVASAAPPRPSREPSSPSSRPGRRSPSARVSREEDTAQRASFRARRDRRARSALGFTARCRPAPAQTRSSPRLRTAAACASSRLQDYPIHTAVPGELTHERVSAE